MTFFGIQDQEVIIKPCFKCTRVSLKIIYYLIKCFFSKENLVLLSAKLQSAELLANNLYVIYQDIKKQGSKYGALEDPCCSFFLYTKAVSDFISLLSVC